MQCEFLSIETAQKLAKAQKIEKNWDELKNWAKERIKNANERLNDPDKNWDEYANGCVLARKFQLEETLKKMQELEGQQ